MKRIQEILPPVLKFTWEFITDAKDYAWEQEYEVTLRAPDNGTPELQIRETGIGSVTITGTAAIRDLQGAVNEVVEALDD